MLFIQGQKDVHFEGVCIFFVLRYQAEILGHSNDRDESVFYFQFQYLKNKINGLSSAFRILVKKVVHCSVIFYKYHVRLKKQDFHTEV